MKLQRSCRDVTRLVLAGEDRALGVGERLGIRLHMLVCRACPRFAAQVAVMREATARWRAYAEPEDAPADGTRRR
ncbi:zf-HC2 domain-containing protein [Aquincola sp. MAHUQ-54]|uniref:Zf-HC2 domain-containing protein n=1 Tax=Aquincola agrisoli TaxID=3119538 RepID=A0AAW9Q9B2_9BURK